MRAAWIALVVLFIALDLYAVFAGKTTFSQLVWSIEDNWPRTRFVMPFVLGLVVCHFWWGR